MARPVFPDWNKVNADSLTKELNPGWAGEASPRQAALNAAWLADGFFAANPQ